MKVFYVTSGLQGCYLVRCLLPMQENGWDGDITSLRQESELAIELKGKAAADADVVVFHRPEQKEKLELMKLLKKNGKKVVFDNDDTLKHDGGYRINQLFDTERVKRGMKRLNENMDAFIGEADLVTCSTEFLAEEYRKINKNVIVLPNCIDPFLFDEPLRNENGKVRIGITGSIAVTDDSLVAEPIVRHYEKDPRVEIVLFSLPPNSQDAYMRDLYRTEYEFWESVNVEWHPFVPTKDYFEALNELRLDIMLIPRADNYFNRCKSNIKFLEASMLEIPVIAQSFPDGKSPYETDKEDARHLVLATDTQSWIDCIEFMLANPKKRNALAKKAHAYVLEKYAIEKNAYKWKEAYETLYD